MTTIRCPSPLLCHLTTYLSIIIIIIIIMAQTMSLTQSRQHFPICGPVRRRFHAWRWIFPTLARLPYSQGNKVPQHRSLYMQ